MNISDIHNMVSEAKSRVFFSTVHCVANPPISSVLIDFVFDLHRRSFVLPLVSLLRHHA
jgi:hypothetical protein